MCKFSPRKRIFWNIWFGDMLSQFNDFHLSKDSGKDKFSKGREEEKSPVETKDVDHLDENLPKKKNTSNMNDDVLHQNYMFI